MKTYLIYKTLTGSFKIFDTFWSTETEKAELEQLNKEMLIKRMKEAYEFIHPITKKYGEASDITFSEIEKYRDLIDFADSYYLRGHFTVRTNKLLSALDVIVEKYNIIKKLGIKSFNLAYLVNDLADVFNTDFKELERLCLLQIEEETK